MRKLKELETSTSASLNRRSGGSLRIGVPKKDSVPTSRIVPDLTQADRAYAIAMDGRRYEDTTRKKGVRVVKPEWGFKLVCQNCAAKCYGLSSSPIACPQCGTHFDPEAPLESCRSRPAAPAKPGQNGAKASIHFALAAQFVVVFRTLKVRHLRKLD